MRFCNGIFAVPKDGARDRMVLDARPPNMLEDATCPWINSLASVSQLEHVFLQKRVRSSGCSLRIFGSSTTPFSFQCRGRGGML